MIDLDTVSIDGTAEDGALSALTGQIVGLGLLVEKNGRPVERAYVGDERVILEKFWQVVKPTDLLVGHNIRHQAGRQQRRSRSEYNFFTVILQVSTLFLY